MSGKDGLLEAIRRVEGGLVLVSIACCVLILVFTNADIAARAMGRSTYLGSELNTLLFSILIYLAAPEVTAKNSHINLSFIYDYTGTTTGRIVKRINAAISALFFVVIAYLFYKFAAVNLANGTRTQGLLNLPVYYIQFAVFAGIALTALRFAVNAVLPGNVDESSDPSTDLYLS